MRASSNEEADGDGVHYGAGARRAALRAPRYGRCLFEAECMPMVHAIFTRRDAPRSAHVAAKMAIIAASLAELPSARVRMRVMRSDAGCVTCLRVMVLLLLYCYASGY